MAWAAVPDDYTYTGLRANAFHGDEGFYSMTVTDGRTSISTVTQFNQGYPFIGTPSYSATTLSNGTVLTSNVTRMPTKAHTPTSIPPMRARAWANHP